MRAPPLVFVFVHALLFVCAHAAGWDRQEVRCSPGARCVPLTSCPEALQRLQDDPSRHPTMCGFPKGSATVPDVCCGQTPKETDCSAATSVRDVHPPTISCKELLEKPYAEDSKSPGRVARKMCRKHQEDLCALEQKLRSAACPSAGMVTDILEFPHMVSK
ncbi:uncharacterized protein LOC117639177 [Thrips palmi]|uniref:Uncharacterized protein LOC117639177 n=1 Tax=Thrips palmi TaxID=161013 RepID=A0A6P8XU81_THRPL|nr:uncharacterized protein LOC117639177 [Thrips palmi]